MAIKTYLQALNDAMRQEMERDENVFIIGEDVGKFGGCFGVTQGLFDHFGERRVRDTPITESAIVGAAAGAAAAGLRPVAELMFVDFIGVALDQLFNQAAKMHYMINNAGIAQVKALLDVTPEELERIFRINVNGVLWGIQAAATKFMLRGEVDGAVKMVADADTGEILGVHIVGSNASELIGEAVLAMMPTAM